PAHLPTPLYTLLPYTTLFRSSGKTALFESLLYVAGAIPRKGTAKEGNTVSDSSAEARARKMSVEVTAATAEYLGDKWCFLDCPRSEEHTAELPSRQKLVCRLP